jgi:hypothetical protein
MTKPKTEPAPNRHGLHSLRRRVALKGLDALDRRSQGARELLAWRRALVSDLGGEAALTEQKKAIIELITRTRLLLDHADSFLFGLESVILKKKKAFVPLVAQRQALVDSLARLLAQLGLERIAQPVEQINVSAIQLAREEIRKLSKKDEKKGGDEDGRRTDREPEEPEPGTVA